MGTSKNGPASAREAAKEELSEAEKVEQKKKTDWLKYLRGAKSHMSDKQWNKIPAAERAAVDALPPDA